MTIDDVNSYERSSFSKYDYFISWQINNICNYHCWFCTMIRKNNYHYTQEDIDYCNEIAIKVAHRLNDELKELDNKKIRMSLIGGEPTLSDIKAILSVLDLGTNYIDITITTNFSCSEEYINDLLQSINDKNIKLKFYVSVHQTETDLNEMIEKVKKYSKNICSVNMVVFDNKSYEEYEYLKDNLKSTNLKVCPQVCMDNSEEGHGKKIYLDKDIMNKLNVNEETTSPDKILNGDPVHRYEIYQILGEIPVWKGFKCWAWTKINYDGKTKTCVHRKFQDYGKILQNDYQICESIKPCKLCFQTKLERIKNED